MIAELVALSPNICLSGGAIGADLQWGMCAGMAGHAVIHWSFKDHHVKAPACEVVVLTEEQLEAADGALNVAKRRLKRGYFAPDSFNRQLLRRNWYQVKDAERVYAVANVDDKGAVSGGTAWAVQMFVDRFDNGPCEVYVYDQLTGLWLTWDGYLWVRAEPPTPFGVYAGVGSRDLKPNGKHAIRDILGYKAAQAA